MIGVLLLALGAGLPDVRTHPADLELPVLVELDPAPGVRALRRLEGRGELAHMLYLPRDWSPGRSYPVIVELPGNGGYQSAFGDRCDGTVAGAALGYGLSGGAGYLWLVLPFLAEDSGVALNWWGDIGRTQEYWLAALDDALENFGGDSERVLLAGFSRGAIGCNYMGLREGLWERWTAFFCHSHYDGVREGWPFEGADRGAAGRRLARLGGRPQWVSHEGSVDGARTYLALHAPGAEVTFGVLPYRNHTDTWVLRDLPLRLRARRWLERVCPQTR